MDLSDYWTNFRRQPLVLKVPACCSRAERNPLVVRRCSEAFRALGWPTGRTCATGHARGLDGFVPRSATCGCDTSVPHEGSFV